MREAFRRLRERGYLLGGSAELMEDKDKWPGVDAAFTFAALSDQWMLTAIEAADSRLQAMTVVGDRVMSGAPTVAKAISGSLELRSPLLAGALVFAVPQPCCRHGGSIIKRRDAGPSGSVASQGLARADREPL